MKGKTLVLVGYMGSGKSYVGKRLAKHLGIPFVDLDDLIVKDQGCPITKIFETKGQDAFREIEHRLLIEQLSKAEPAVLATGGGAPCFMGNMDLIKSQSFSVFLDADIPVLAKRLETEIDKRPILHGQTRETLPGFIEAKMRERRPFYELADCTISIYRLSQNPVASIAELYLSWSAEN